MPTNATLINLFEVPTEVSDEDFVAWWVRARDFLNDRVGVIPTALHRSIRPDAQFRFVNVAQIPDVEAWQAALADPEFPGREEMPGRPHPTLYEVVADRTRRCTRWWQTPRRSISDEGRKRSALTSANASQDGRCDQAPHHWRCDRHPTTWEFGDHDATVFSYRRSARARSSDSPSRS